MSVPVSAIGQALPTVTATIERGRLRFFAESIGETDPRYVDVEAARDAGHRDLPVPPTFLFGVKLDSVDPLGWLTDLGLDPRLILHGAQRFEYHRMAYAGDELAMRPRILDVYEKKGGALEFIVVETEVSRDGEAIATMTETIIARHPDRRVSA